MKGEAQFGFRRHNEKIESTLCRCPTQSTQSTNQPINSTKQAIYRIVVFCRRAAWCVVHRCMVVLVVVIRTIILFAGVVILIQSSLLPSGS
jgi:hypothetical protein